MNPNHTPSTPLVYDLFLQYDNFADVAMNIHVNKLLTSTLSQLNQNVEAIFGNLFKSILPFSFFATC
jgi:hypothetical protein